MTTRLNFKHLRYFWMVAKTGSIAIAAEQLQLTPQSISGQLSEFETQLGVRLFRRVGRRLEIDEAGRRILGYAENIFALEGELLEAVRDIRAVAVQPLRVGIADSVSKSMVYHLLAPALAVGGVRLICREGRLAALLADLAVHRLDTVVADRPLPENLNVRGYSHRLGESDLTAFATPGLRASLVGEFPACLDGAPFLLPGEDVTWRPALWQWFERHSVQPRAVGEFDDSALLKAFGQAGAGVFVAPSAIAEAVCAQYQVVALGRLVGVREPLYVITPERRLTHPAIVAISTAAREDWLS